MRTVTCNRTAMGQIGLRIYHTLSKRCTIGYPDCLLSLNIILTVTVKVSSDIAQYPIFGIGLNALHFTLWPTCSASCN